MFVLFVTAVIENDDGRLVVQKVYGEVGDTIGIFERDVLTGPPKEVIINVDAEEI